MNQSTTQPTFAAPFDWRTLIPHNNGDDQGARLRHENALWHAGMFLHRADDGRSYLTCYPLTQHNFACCFGEWLNSHAQPGLFPKSEARAEPDHPLAFACWIEFLSEPERAAHFNRCKAAWKITGEVADVS